MLIWNIVDNNVVWFKCDSKNTETDQRVEVHQNISLWTSILEIDNI